ncbi:MAG: Sec-independent protein translocase subunit TatA/TatB [Acidimicrobiales bacterium]
MPSTLGPGELLVVAVFALIVLGPNRLPGAARKLGETLAEVRRWSANIRQEIDDAISSDSVSSGQTPEGVAPGKGDIPLIPRTPTPLATPANTAVTAPVTTSGDDARARVRVETPPEPDSQ